MANQGLFTQGPSVEDLLTQRNKRAFDLQQSLMQNAAQGARDPAKAQAISLLGSSLGRALAGSMGEDEQLKKAREQEEASKASFGGFLEAVQKGGSDNMFAEAARLQEQGNQMAALKMMELAKAEKVKEENMEAAKAAASAAAEKARLKRAQDLEDRDLTQQENILLANLAAENDMTVAEYKADLEDKRQKVQDNAKKVTPMSGKQLMAKYPNLTLEPEATYMLDGNGGFKVLDTRAITEENANKPPKGFMEAVVDGELRYVPIPGSPQARKIAEEEAADQQKQVGKNVYGEAFIHAGENLIDQLKNESLFSPVTGATGAIASKAYGKERKKAESLVKTLEAQLSFGALQNMRDSSKTGGALGSITERELQLLGSLIGSIDLDMQGEDLIPMVENMLDRYVRLEGIALGYQNGQLDEDAALAAIQDLPSPIVGASQGSTPTASNAVIDFADL